MYLVSFLILLLCQPASPICQGADCSRENSGSCRFECGTFAEHQVPGSYEQDSGPVVGEEHGVAVNSNESTGLSILQSLD
ncbi:hypothetical protein B0H13DRAFT_2130088, partial [Mycena leptocephala]